MTQHKPVLEPDNVLDACDQITGRLEGMPRKAEAEVPVLGVRAMHPLIWGAAGSLWRGGHYREAVAGAAEALVSQATTERVRRCLQWKQRRTRSTCVGSTQVPAHRMPYTATAVRNRVLVTRVTVGQAFSPRVG